MPITFVPEPGTVLICNFDTGFRPPEMVKTRRVVVMSHRYRRSQGVCLVIPFSTTPPAEPELYHYKMPKGRYPFLNSGQDVWAKANMLSHVGYGRLDRLKVNGQWTAPYLESRDLIEIQKALFHALGLSHLTNYL